MGFFSEIKSALNEIFSEFSQPVIFRDREYNCIIGDGGQQEAELESGGFVSNENFSIKFKESDFENDIYPAIGEILQYSGRRFRIHWINSRSNRGQIEVFVRSVDK